MSLPPSFVVGGQQYEWASRRRPQPGQRKRGSGRVEHERGGGADRERRAEDEEDDAPPDLGRTHVLPLLAPTQRLQHGNLLSSAIYSLSVWHLVSSNIHGVITTIMMKRPISGLINFPLKKHAIGLNGKLAENFDIVA